VSAHAELLDPATGGKDGGPIHLLFLKGNLEIGFGNTIDLDKTLLEKLAEQGFRCTAIRDYHPLSVEFLKQFNCVVWIGPTPISGGPYFNPATWRGGVHTLTVKKNAEVLRQYVERGGGLLINPVIEEAGMSRIEALKELMAPYGANPECAQVRDETNKFVAFKFIRQFPAHFCWTEAITKHPATEGVKRIYYTDYMMRWDDNYTTIPVFPTDRAWTVLVRGMPGSYCGWKQGTVFEWGFWKAGPKKWNEPPIVSVRELGKGRVAVAPIMHFSLFYFPYSKKTNYWEDGFGLQDGRLMETGDGKTPSDLAKLMTNLYRWLSGPGAKLGFGAYDAEKGIKPTPIPEPVPKSTSEAWAHEDPMTTGPVRPMKILVGARTAASDGKGSVADYARAAKEAGYDLVCFTETFEKLTDDGYRALVDDCRKLTDDEVAFLPGIDIADSYGSRFLIVGKPRPIRPHLLMPNGKSEPTKRLIWSGHMTLGMGDVLPIAARPARLAQVREAGCLPPDLYSHCPGVAIATYRGEEQVDDGLFAYKWQLFNSSIPIPIAVHEVFSPDEVALAAQTGMQCYVNSDTPAHAAYYFRQGLESYGGNPMRYYISSGPLVDSCKLDDWKSPHWSVHLKAHGPEPITEVIIRDQRRLHRRFTPRSKAVDLKWHGDLGAHQWFLVELRDARGGKAYLSPIRTLPPKNFTRCMDRQNWFALPRKSAYTGRLRTYQGRYKPSLPGVKLAASLCPLIQLTYAANGCMVLDWKLGQTLVPGRPRPGIDSYPIFNALPIPEYDCLVRSIWTTWPVFNDATEVTITLKKDLTAAGEVWPVVGKAGPKYMYNDPETGERIEGTVEKGKYVDLPIGGGAGDIVTLTPLRLSDRGEFGFAGPGDGKVVKAGTVYQARFLRAKGKLVAVRRQMGFDGPTPYTFKLTQGKHKAAGWVVFEAEDAGIAGTVSGPLPSGGRARVNGVSPDWPFGVWSDQKDKNGKTRIIHYGFIDGQVATTRFYNVKDGAKFYFGNLLVASDPDLCLNFASPWTEAAAMDSEEPVTVEVHNPTDKPITATIRTPKAIADRKQVHTEVTVPAGASTFVKVE